MTEDLLYDLTKDVVDDFDSLVIYRLSPSDSRFPRTAYLQDIICEKIENTTNTKEKRLLKSLIYYLYALRGYYNYLEIVENYERRSMSAILGDNKEKVRHFLGGALKSLEDGKKYLDEKEDISSISFLDNSISVVLSVLDKTQRIENEYFEKKLQDAGLDSKISKDILYKKSPQERKNIIEKEIEARKRACIKENKIYRSYRWVALICFILFLINLNIVFYFIFAIFAGLKSQKDDMISQTSNPNYDSLSSIIGFLLGFIFAPMLFIGCWSNENLKKTYNLHELNHILSEINQEIN